MHRLTPPNSYFPYWDITDDPSYIDSAETKYAEATGIALLDEDGNLLNEFACYDEDGPMQKAKIRVRAMARDDGFGSTRASNLALYVENTGAAPVNGFEVRYYYRDSAETELDINWNEFASARKINAGGDLNYASFVYEDVILNAGEKSDYGNGVQFALHHPNWTDDFNADDDPSHYNLKSGEMAEADSVLILDKLGNLLWGHAPQPKFGTGCVVRENSADLMRRDGKTQDYIDSHLFTVRDVVNVASMIEKETASAEEGYTIASVIYNRLFCWHGNPAYLNIDATIIYALNGKNDLTAEDLRVDSPYNTYTNVGLTPGPISNPGLSSLKAALEPADTNYYYYVLDPTAGTHVFATTQEEHDANRAKFGG